MIYSIRKSNSRARVLCAADLQCHRQSQRPHLIYFHGLSFRNCVCYLPVVATSGQAEGGASSEGCCPPLESLLSFQPEPFQHIMKHFEMYEPVGGWVCHLRGGQLERSQSVGTSRRCQEIVSQLFFAISWPRLLVLTRCSSRRTLMWMMLLVIFVYLRM